MSMHSILWLEKLSQAQSSHVGAKAHRLARILEAGMLVPAAFCIPAAVYDAFIRANDLESRVIALLAAAPSRRPALAIELQEAIQAGAVPEPCRREIAQAYQQLATLAGGTACPVAVRSSGSAEDLLSASSAGQQLTMLNVRGEEGLLRAIHQCWASLWSPQAVLYRDAYSLTTPPTMAILVQLMVDAEAAGVAFSIDPISGREQVVIEAAFGLGESVVRGEGDVDRYVASRQTCLEIVPPLVARKLRMHRMAMHAGVQVADVPAELRDARVLTSQQVQDIARAVLRLEELFSAPQDVEWAWSHGELFILQSRPTTANGSSFFTDPAYAEDSMWTAGFVNERFPSPVSPLGWSLIRELLEELAFRDPLRYLGVKNAEQIAVTRLYQGHPYVNVFVFQTLYKVFPSWLLPEDAGRYFPRADTSLRLKAPYPRSVLDPRFLFSMLRHFLRHPALWSPWHNYRVWASFAAEHESRSRELGTRHQAMRESTTTLAGVWEAIEAAQALNSKLLSIHRWSLTWADLSYSLLRRILSASAGPEKGMALAAGLVSGLPNQSKEVNGALQALAQARDTPGFRALLDGFLARYGHRSFSLDIYVPPFGDEPQQVLELLDGLNANACPAPAERQDHEPVKDCVLRMWDNTVAGWLKRGLFVHVLNLAQRYMPLREEQRFLWQKTLALQRRLFLLLAERMVAARALTAPQDVFFLTKGELRDYVGSPDAGTDYAAPVVSRRRQLWRLRQQHESDAALAYPAFLRGDHPLESGRQPQGSQWRGRPVSPGLARGRAVVVHSLRGLRSIRPGDVLVTHSADPAWTPVFGSLSALILERGGQLSHGAVVAREYGLPAVTGIPGIMRALHTGDLVAVDGSTGSVTRIQES